MSTPARIARWSELFESAQSKRYKHKSQCYMPNKQGVGYRRIMKDKRGPAVFGAWCALVQCLSRHEAPREGYLTEDGTPDGIPLTAEHIAVMVDMPESLVAHMLTVCESTAIRWIIDGKHTTNTPQTHHANTIETTHSDLRGYGKGKGKGKGEGKGEGQPGGNGSRLSHCDTYGEFGKVRLTPDEHAKLVAKHGADTVDRAISALDAWKESKGKTTKNDYAAMNAASWVWRAAEDAKNSQPHESIFT